MKDKEPTKEASVYKILSNISRRKIIEMIGSEGKTSFTKLKKELKISVGALYHHIDALGDIITQDDQHRYMLTRQGKLVFKLLNETGDQLSFVHSEFSVESSASTSNRLASAAQIFLPRRLLLSVSDKPILYLPAAAIIVALGSWIAVHANLRFILVFPDSQTSMPPDFTAALFVISWLLVFGLSDITSTFIFRRKGGDLSLLVGSSVSFIPLIFFSGLWYVFRAVHFDMAGIIAPFLLLACQLWTIGVLSCTISLSKGLRMDKSALISFTVIYVNIAFFLLRQIYW